jgi:hypothetical protein
LNPSSFEKIAFHNLKKIADIILTKDYKAARRAYESVCGEFGTGKDKLWVVDIDNPADLREVYGTTTDKIRGYLYELMIEAKQPPVVYEIPTRNGFHFITKPFNLKKFHDLYPFIDVHKQNPTILYMV